jgi:hypothetical protein
MRKNWLLPLANLLCLIHCVGVGLLSASAPLWLSGLHLEWLEYLLVIFNLIVGVKVFQTLPLPRYRIYILVTGLSLAFIGLVFELHDVYHASIALTAIYQIVTLIQFHNKKNHDNCTCDHHTPLSPSLHKNQVHVAKLLRKWQKEPLAKGEDPDKNWAEFEQDLKNDPIRFTSIDEDEDKKKD